jgi:hypothetical protein
VSNIKSNTLVSVYSINGAFSINGALVKSFKTDVDTNFNLNKGVWIVIVKATDGQKAIKLITY